MPTINEWTKNYGIYLQGNTMQPTETNKVMSFSETWMELKDITKPEKGETQPILTDIMNIYNIYIYGYMEFY